jgi:hypothetical protein
MVGAAVPEATIDIDRHPRPWEENVGPSPQRGIGRSINPVPKATRVKEPAQFQLGPGVATRHPCHLTTDLPARRPWSPISHDRTLQRAPSVESVDQAGQNIVPARRNVSQYLINGL